MLNNSFFDGGDDLPIINTILYDFHRDGPVSQNHLESLAYIKSFQPAFFKRYESKLIFYMGLFYKTGKPKNFIEAVYESYANAILEDTGRKFTPTQADAYKAIKSHTNFSFSAPTSAGKSFLFQEIIKETKADTVIVIPSRALLSEYLIKVQNIVANTTLVLPFIEIVNTKNTTNRIYIITPERGEELFKNIDRLNIELILLDEAQLSEEGIRGLKFDSFVRRVEKKLPNVKKVFTHPFVTNPQAQFIKHNITNRINSEAYNQKTVGKIYLEHRKQNFKFFSPFEDQIKGKAYQGNFIKQTISEGGTVLIYTSKAKIYDGSYRDEFSEYIDLCDEVVDKKALLLIARVEEFFGTKNDSDKYSNLIFLMQRGIVIHHGSIPLKARLIIEEFVNGKYAKICFSTSTLIQGINMPFDVVWINHFLFNGNEDQKTLSLKNLIGRAGRTSTKNSFDFGYVVVEARNKNIFTKRLNQESSLSETSELDSISSANNEDYIDLVEAIKNDTFDTDLHLTNSQIERISLSDVNKDIDFLLDNFFTKNLDLLSPLEYYSLSDYFRKKIKVAFERIYKAHLRRQTLTNGERSVLSTAIPILLWQIQGKSFAEIVSLRFAFLSEKDFRRKLRKQRKSREINNDEYDSMLQDKKVRFSCIAHPLPDKNFKFPIPLFSLNTSILDIDFDKVIYDTYDYIDKVISLSIRDPLVGALMVYYRERADERALVLSNYIKHGTNDVKEIWLLKYGFSFDEIERMADLVENIDETGIKFKDSILQFIKDNPDITLVSRYL
jgi:replicative superfamily II helicase